MPTACNSVKSATKNLSQIGSVSSATTWLAIGKTNKGLINGIEFRHREAPKGEGAERMAVFQQVNRINMTNFQRKLANAKGAITLEVYEKAVIASAKRKVKVIPVKVKRAVPMLDYAGKALERKATKARLMEYNANRNK